MQVTPNKRDVHVGKYGIDLRIVIFEFNPQELGFGIHRLQRLTRCEGGFTGSDPQKSLEFSHLAMVSRSSVSTQPSLNGKVIAVSVFKKILYFAFSQNNGIGSIVFSPDLFLSDCK